jgi:hypothetical protein
VGIRRQSELRHGKELAAHVLEREVHLALRVGEDAVGEHALGESRGFCLAVAALDADQREDALADGGDLGAVDAYRGAGNPLYQGDQAMMSGINRARRR